MFEEVLGIPAHPLLVHAAVVFVPLLVLGAFAYALLPLTRRYVWWAVLGLGVIAPSAAWAAKLSGQAFRARLIRHGAHNPDFLGQIDRHMSFGNLAAYFATGLGALSIIMVLVLHSRVRASQGSAASIGATGGGSVALSVILIVLVVGVGAATGYYIFRTGDTGAHIVWGGQ